jgi:predicted peroxiredoxin
MSNNTTSPQKFLINCSDGINDVERATVAFIMAVAASTTSETAVFATADASVLCVKGGADGLSAEGYTPLAELVTAFLANQGRIWLCPACAKAKGITPDDLIDGVEIAGVPTTVAYLADGAQLLA